MKYMKRVVAVCIFSIFTFTAVAVIYQAVNGVELSPTLTERFFTVIGLELGATALIKIGEAYAEKLRVKLEKENKEDSNNDNY